MHDSCKAFWKHVSEEFASFCNEDILEFGSYNINGTIRDYFTNCKRYIGIDWRPGPCVDVVSLAHEAAFDFQAKAVFSASMLEHDPYWEKSIDNMIKYLKPGGILVLTWGAAQNVIHCLGEAPDGEFHCLSAGKVIDFLEKRGIFIYTSIYDADLGNIIRDFVHISPHDGYGEFNLIAIKRGIMSPLVDGDKL